MAIWTSCLLGAMHHIATACCKVIGRVGTGEAGWGEEGWERCEVMQLTVCHIKPWTWRCLCFTQATQLKIRWDVSFIAKLECTYHRKTKEMLDGKHKK